MNLRNLNPGKITFLVSFLCETIFPPLTHRTRLKSKDVEFYCASFDISEKFVASCAPMDTPTRKLKNEFSGRNSQGIYPNLEYFLMILKAIQTLLLKIKIIKRFCLPFFFNFLTRDFTAFSLHFSSCSDLNSPLRHPSSLFTTKHIRSNNTSL